MNYFEEVKKELYKFEGLGLEKSELGAILIGKAPHIAPMAWLHSLYPILTEAEVDLLEKNLGTAIPKDYKDFLLNYSNGLDFFASTFSLDGMRKEIGRTIEDSRQPFSLIVPNTIEKPNNAKANQFFIGGYEWDGSKLYIDNETSKVHYCDRWDATSLYEWNSFAEMLLSEVKRITSLFDEKGVILNEDLHTTPIEIK
jgi:hypothetical protein